MTLRSWNIAHGPFRFYLGLAPGVGHTTSKQEIEVRVAVTIGPVLLKGSTVLARV